MNFSNCQKLKNDAAIEISLILPELLLLEYLTINLGRNNLTCEGLTQLSDAISKIANLKKLSLVLRENKIKEEGAKNLSKCLSILKNLFILELDLGGFSVLKNSIGEEGGAAIAKSLGFLTDLVDLEIDLGFNDLKDSNLIDLALSFKNLTKLRRVYANLYQCKFGEKGAVKFVKSLKKLEFLKII